MDRVRQVRVFPSIDVHTHALTYQCGDDIDRVPWLGGKLVRELKTNRPAEHRGTHLQGEAGESHVPGQPGQLFETPSPSKTIKRVGDVVQ